MKTLLKFSVVVVFALCCTFAVKAQSGRRQAPPPPSAPIPTPTPEPTPVAQTKVEDKNRTGFIVGMDRNGAFTAYPTSFYDVVLSACAERLRRASTAWVDLVRDDMNRGQALKRAKEESTGYVVYLQLNTSTMSNSSNQNYSDIEIEYSVFSPSTGKLATQGRGYQNAQRKGPLVVNPPIGTNSSMVREQLLAMAAEDVADRILKALHVLMTK